MTAIVQHLLVADRDGTVAIGRDDLVKYAGPSQIIASALIFRLFERAFRDLSPQRPPERDTIQVLIAFPGDGILDCIEMVARARTRGRLTIDENAGPSEAPIAPAGRFYFEIELPAGRRGYWPREGYFDARFRDLVARWQEAPASPQREAYIAFKQELVGRILGAPADDLFHCREIPRA